jgi:integrase
MAGPEVTHETLDAAAAGTAGTRAAERLRGLLTAAGALPYRDSGMRRYEERVAEILASVPAASQMAVRRYARWAVTRPLQARAADGEAPSADLIQWPLARIRAAAQFTAGLAEAGQPLAAVTQSHLDAWTAEVPGSAPALRGFVNWAAAHGYMPASLEVPGRNAREDRRGMDDEERLALAERLLRTPEGEPRDRLGAILILLFGQHATRMARLKASAVSLDADGRVYIALGDTPVRLREPLAHLAVTVADDARRAGSQWLFPGENGPMSSDRFRDRLATVGVTSVLMARNSALAAFAADVPPALLADKLGLSISAAVEWSKAVAAVRADYAGLRDGHGPAARKRCQALLPASASPAHMHPQAAQRDGVLIAGHNGDLPVRAQLGDRAVEYADVSAARAMD